MYKLIYVVQSARRQGKIIAKQNYWKITNKHWNMKENVPNSGGELVYFEAWCL